MKVMVVGGPGVISSSAIQELADRGDTVLVFNRSTDRFGEVDRRVRTLAGDRDRPRELESVFEEFGPDVVLDFACYLPDQARRMVAMAEGRVSHLVVASTVDVYGYPLTHLPFREDDPWQPATISQYAADKRLCEEILRANHDPETLPVTIVRPAYSFGPRFLLSALDRAGGPALIHRLRNRLPILVPGDGTTLIHVSSGYNTGRMAAALIGVSMAIGNEYTLAHPEFTDYAGYMRLLGSALDVEPVLACVPSDVILSVDDPAMEGNLLAELLRYNIAFSADRFMADVPGFEFEPLETAARRAVEWNVERGLITDAPIIDDRIIAAFHARTRGFAI